MEVVKYLVNNLYFNDMKNHVLVFLLMFSAVGVWAENVPTLLILTTNSGEVQIPIASIQKITYDESGATMYVSTAGGNQSYAVANISQMTLNNVPAATALNQLTDSPIPQLTKFEKNGVVYVVKEGKVYTLKGEKL